MSVKPIPEGFHTVTPVLAVEGGVEALGFYERAFGAEVRLKLVMGGKLMHSELRIGDSIVCVSDSFPEFGSVAPYARRAGPGRADDLHRGRRRALRPRRRGRRDGRQPSPTTRSTATARARCATRTATAG